MRLPACSGTSNGRVFSAWTWLGKLPSSYTSFIVGLQNAMHRNFPLSLLEPVREPSSFHGRMLLSATTARPMRRSVVVVVNTLPQIVQKKTML